MPTYKVPRSVCAVVGEVLATTGSHTTLEALFRSAGVPGDPPDLAHHSKWKTWLYQAANDPTLDGLSILGSVIEEFMDLGPDENTEEYEGWMYRRKRVVDVLEQSGFRYYRGGRVLPDSTVPAQTEPTKQHPRATTTIDTKPSSIQELVQILARSLPRAMHPLAQRKNRPSLTFESEYDVQDLLHALLRPWVADIRPEEFTPSYAGSSTRMDFLLPAHSLVIEMKYVRDRAHGRKIGDELIIDIEHYRRHPECKVLWCIVYDPNSLLINREGLRSDLEGLRLTPDGEVSVKVLVV